MATFASPTVPSRAATPAANRNHSADAVLPRWVKKLNIITDKAKMKSRLQAIVESNTELRETLHEYYEADANNDSYEWRYLSGATSNVVITCQTAHREHSMVILRIYGSELARRSTAAAAKIESNSSNSGDLQQLPEKRNGEEKKTNQLEQEQEQVVLLDRANEIAIFEWLSGTGLGPKLLKSFSFGRIEEFVTAPALTPTLLRDPVVSSKISVHMARIHREGQIFLDSVTAPFPLPTIWDYFHRWVSDARKRKLWRVHEALDLNAIVLEINFLQNTMDKYFDSTKVFCHSDLNYGNILYETGGPMVFVDFEYACIGYRGQDIGNYFCEWAADYHSDSPHLLDYERFPTKEEQVKFIKKYTKEALLSEKDIEDILFESLAGCLISHMMWCLWAILQSSFSNIDFDYITYGVQRMEQYTLNKPAAMKLITSRYDIPAAVHPPDATSPDVN